MDELGDVRLLFGKILVRQTFILFVGFVQLCKVKNIIEWRVKVCFLFEFFGRNDLVYLVDLKLVDFCLYFFFAFLNVEVVHVIFVFNLN